jgi:ankyrin repeat protein
MFQTIQAIIEEHQDKKRFMRLIKCIESGNYNEFTNLLEICFQKSNFTDYVGILFRETILETSNIDFLSKLLEYKINPNVKDVDSVTPLHQAVESGDPRKVKLLLDYKANPNAQDNRGVTALHIANSYDGTSDIIQLLLKYGANPGIKDNLGKVYLM